MSRNVLTLDRPIRRPKGIARLAGGNPLTDYCRYLSICETHFPRDLISNTQGVPSSVAGVATYATLDGTGCAINAGSNCVAIASAIDDIVPLDKCTIVMAKRKVSSTSGGTHFGHSVDATNKCRINAPFTDGKIYWVWGNNNIATSALSWTLDMDYFVFVAGPTKGLEIWRNGTLQTSGAYPGTRAANTNEAQLGSTVYSVDQSTFTIFGVFDIEWSDSQILNWFSAPYQLFERPRSRAFNKYLPVSNLTPDIFVNTNTFHSPTVTSKVTLLPGLATNTNTFYAPSVSASYTLSPQTVTNSNTFYNPSVSSIGNLTPELVSNTNTFYSPSISSSFTLSPELVTNENVFYSPTVSTFYELTPGLVTNSNTFYTPIVTDDYLLTPSLYVNSNTFFSPSVAPGSVALTPSLLTNTNVIYSPTVRNIFGTTNIFVEFSMNELIAELNDNNIFIEH